MQIVLIAASTAQSTDVGTAWLDVGGPELFTHKEIARLVFAALERPARLTHLPDGLRRLALRLLTLLAPLGYGTDQVDAAAVAAFIHAKPAVLIAWNTMIYILNALALIVLVVALNMRLRPLLPGWSAVAQAMAAAPPGRDDRAPSVKAGFRALTNGKRLAFGRTSA